MKLTPQRKVCFAVLALAGAALAADRLVFSDGGPATASASPNPSQLQNASMTGRLTAYAKVQNALCTRLEAIKVDPASLNDPFQIVPLWAPMAKGDLTETKANAQKGDIATTFKLTSIALVNRASGERLAVINGHSLSLGDAVIANKLPTDYHVVGIDPTAVWISNGVKDLKLSLDGGGDKRSLTSGFYGVRSAAGHENAEKTKPEEESSSSR